MIALREIVAEHHGLSEDQVRRWVTAEWVVATQEDGDLVFSEREAARLRLLRDMTADIGIEEDTLPVILSLLDQVYDLRTQLRCMSAAIRRQPEQVRAAIRETIAEILEE